MLERKLRLAVFASSIGSNMRAIHQQILATPDAPIEFVLCVSNNEHPAAFDYCIANAIPTATVQPPGPLSEQDSAEQLLDVLRNHAIDMIALAGYLKRIPAAVVDAYKGRIVNVHPALLPKYGGAGMYGANVHRAVLESGDHESGVTVHLVDNDYDTGTIIAQQPVPVLADDTVASLSERVLQLEHHLYPETIIALARSLFIN